MSFKKPYQASKGKVVHRASRKAKPSATVGFLKPKRYRKSKQAEPPRPSARDTVVFGPLSEGFVVPEGWSIGHNDEGEPFAYREVSDDAD